MCGRRGGREWTWEGGRGDGLVNGSMRERSGEDEGERDGRRKGGLCTAHTVV